VVTIARRYWWSDEDKRRFFRAWCANAQFAELGEGLGTGPDAAMGTIYRWFAAGATTGALNGQTTRWQWPIANGSGATPAHPFYAASECVVAHNTANALFISSAGT
jgi:hypothetical protein